VAVDINITSATEGHAAVVTVQGAVDLASRGALIEQGKKALTLANTNALVVDLAGVTFIDSSGVGALVELAGQADDVGRDFTIRHPSDRVVRILDVTGLLQLWTIASAD
jgi:anti-sigma B factor antagonist